MTTPRLEIDLDKITHNARNLIRSLTARGISVTGVAKATLGSPEVADALLRAGVQAIGDSRIENIEAMRRACVPATMVLMRSPKLGEAERVVAQADVSFNTELDVIRELSGAAQRAKRTHGIVLMVELGDLREGIMPCDLEGMTRELLSLPNITLKGIGANLACRSGVSPDAKNMSELSRLADSLEAAFNLTLSTVSGGGSANLDWALGAEETGRINNLRLGESILLGCEPLHRQPIRGLHTDAIRLVTEVIESKIKPSQPWGKIAQTAFGEKPFPPDRGLISQVILAVGHQDTDPDGLLPPSGIEILGASSDHLVINSGRCHLSIGAEVTFQLNYSAMLRAMTSPFVTKVMIQRDCPPLSVANHGAEKASHPGSITELCPESNHNF